METVGLVMNAKRPLQSFDYDDDGSSGFRFGESKVLRLKNGAHLLRGGKDVSSDAVDRLSYDDARGIASAFDTTIVDADDGFDARREPRRRRKLVLHFDARNTILVSDSVTNDNVEQALNTFLAGVTWGRSIGDGVHAPRAAASAAAAAVADDESGKWGDDLNDSWVWCSDRPSLTAPCPGAITFYKSLERRLVRSPADRLRLRQATGDFTQRSIGRLFQPYFEKHLKLLEWNDESHGIAASATAKPPTADAKIVTNGESRTTNENGLPATMDVKNGEVGATLHDRKTAAAVLPVDPKLTISGSNGRYYHYLMPSFVKLIYDLHAAGRQFAVVVRTYGLDAGNVLTSAEHVIAGNHPQFPGSLPIRVRTNPGRIRRHPGERIICEPPNDLLVSTNGTADESDTQPSAATAIDTDGDIYRMLSEFDGVSGFMDDFRYWQDHDYCHLAGKPLWIDPLDESVQHIFFDDNIRVSDNDSIVDVRMFDDDEDCDRSNRQRTCRSLALSEISSLENVCLVQANLLECTSDVDYFKRKVEECEVNYSIWLKARALQRRRRAHVERTVELKAATNGHVFA